MTKYYKALFILVSFFIAHGLFAQSSYNTYFVQFRDKADSQFSLSNPSAYLSTKAVERRIRTGIGFDSLDLPVNENYIQQVLQQGNSNLLLKSKWFNSITVELVDTAIAAAWKQQVESLPCVYQVKSLPSVPLEKISIHKGTQSQEGLVSDDFYGPSFRQTEMLNGHLLHQLGLNGQGMDIAVFDGGFLFANVLPAMSHLFEEGRVIETHDFLHYNSPEVFDASTHGTMVLSHMAGIMQDSLYGTAVEANYYLFQTEDVFREVRLEEDTWIQAAEWADSIGIDVINSSLGYSLFDEDYMNYSTSDMNGSTTRISQAAEICALKGTLVVNSAGNSGDDPWHVITAPSDAEHVMCIGAVDLNGNHASFSGFHPPGLEGVKPNVVAMGRQTVYASMDSTISRGNGTSFSCHSSQEWQPHFGKHFQLHRIWIYSMPLNKVQVYIQLPMILWDMGFLIFGRLSSIFPIRYTVNRMNIRFLFFRSLQTGNSKFVLKEIFRIQITITTSTTVAAGLLNIISGNITTVSHGQSII